MWKQFGGTGVSPVRFTSGGTGVSPVRRVSPIRGGFKGITRLWPLTLGGTATSAARGSAAKQQGRAAIWLRRSIAPLAIGAALACPTVGLADAFDEYHETGQFALPAADAFDVLNDGRLIALNGSTVLTETAVASRTFTPRTTALPAGYDASGSAFAAVSPDGSQIAVGNNGGANFDNFQVGVFNLDDLSGEVYNLDHFEAGWYDNQHLAITAGEVGRPGFVTALDTSSDPGSPSNPTIIEGIGGASAGVTRDASGRLYTGNGFDSDSATGSDTGDIKAFAAAAVSEALAGGAPIDFEAGGDLIADLLSAGSLGFDGEGNLHVGGSESFSGDDFFALADDAAIEDALSSDAVLATGDSSRVRQFDPDPAGGNRYSVSFNPVTDELYARPGGGSTTVYTLAVPEPGTLALLGLGAFPLLLRRRRSPAPGNRRSAADPVPSPLGERLRERGRRSPIGFRGGRFTFEASATTSRSSTSHPLPARFARRPLPQVRGDLGSSAGWAMLTLVVACLVAPASAGPYSAFDETDHLIDPGVASDDARITGWASNVAANNPTGEGGAGSAANVLGPYTASTYSLGDLSESDINSNAARGAITLGFDRAITNGEGYDFTVFENGGDFFGSETVALAELAHVAVSTNGSDFARLPGLSLNEEGDLNTTFGRAFAGLDTTNVFNFAGKHGGGVGTGFNLDDLSEHPLVTGGEVDLSEINYVRVIDVPGDGSFSDSEGNPILDAWNTNNNNNTGGFDLQAVGVMNTVPTPTTATWLVAGGALLMVPRRKRSRA